MSETNGANTASDSNENNNLTEEQKILAGFITDDQGNYHIPGRTETVPAAKVQELKNGDRIPDAIEQENQTKWYRCKIPSNTDMLMRFEHDDTRFVLSSWYYNFPTLSGGPGDGSAGPHGKETNTNIIRILLRDQPHPRVVFFAVQGKDNFTHSSDDPYYISIELHSV